MAQRIMSVAVSKRVDRPILNKPGVSALLAFCMLCLGKEPDMPTPRFLDDPAYRDLREGDVQHFEQHTANRKQVDFSGTDLRGVDLRNVDVGKLVLRDAYLRDADLRGLDLRKLDMEGCSLHGAQISGTYFPANLSAQEIRNSVEYGTRIRTSG
jgi:uncharacterized protein YjbI with pentapeptide repeats